MNPGAQEEERPMLTRCVQFILITLLLSVLHGLVAGCARQPALTQASAPALAGQVAVTSALAPPASGSPAPVTEAQPSAVPGASAAPTAERPRPADFVAVAPLTEVYFDFDKSTIRPDAAETLDASAEWLNANRTQLVLIEGHCDERGTDQYNLALADRRARATMDYLISRGVQPGRLAFISYGKERPVCTEHLETCWSRNRRAVLLFKAG
jgi:peptidoglycan-associated lipoprotein